MARVLVLARSVPQVPAAEWLRMGMVCGCALSLILARATLPF